VATTDFDLGLAEKRFLFNHGVNAAREFLAEWSWAKYKRWAKEIRGIEE
jgi:hypothetical protein